MADIKWSRNLQGIAHLAVYEVLARGDSHGYAIAQTLTDAGLPVSEHFVYGVLAGAKRNKRATVRTTDSRGGPHRKTYTLTEAGREALAEGRQQLDQHLTVLHSLRQG